MSKGLLAKCSTFVIIICTTLLATPVITNNVSCPPGWVFWGSNCYYFYATIWKSWTWDNAQSKCVSQGGFYGYNSALTSIHSEEENLYIYDEILGMTPENYPYPVWIGFRSDDGWFRWIDGTEVNYTRWDKQAYQPGGGISPNCVIMRLQGAYVGSHGYWYDGYDCETWTGGTLTVCKTSTEPEIPPTDDCPPFWVSWGSHCYYFSDKKTDYLQTWYDAQSFCEEKTENSFNSTLASIHSREENNYISDTLTMLNLIGYVWIGLSEGTAETPFEQWTDGSALQYTNWLPGYPSYPSDNSSACGYMSVDGSRGSSQWGNIPCDSKGYRTTVCKGSTASI